MERLDLVFVLISEVWGSFDTKQSFSRTSSLQYLQSLQMVVRANKLLSMDLSIFSNCPLSPFCVKLQIKWHMPCISRKHV